MWRCVAKRSAGLSNSHDSHRGRFLDNHAADISFAKARVGEYGTGNIGTGNERVAQVCAGQIGAGEIGLGQVGPPFAPGGFAGRIQKIGGAQIRVAEISAGECCLGVVAARHHRAGKIGAG